MKSCSDIFQKRVSAISQPLSIKGLEFKNQTHLLLGRFELGDIRVVALFNFVMNAFKNRLLFEAAKKIRNRNRKLSFREGVK